jgi:hypothetical protein
MGRRMPLVFAIAVLLVALATQARAGDALPDLVPIIDDAFYPTTITRDASVDPQDVAEGCAAAATGRTLVHFTASTRNEGAADLVLGDPGCPEDCAAFPGPTCTNELFECSPLGGHGHPHFTQYALYEILPAPGATAVASGHKQSFCLEDSDCAIRTYNCFNQGLTAGCKDVYPPFVLGCQYVDVTGLPGGRYVLRFTVNYAQVLLESRYDNNVAERMVELCEPIPGPDVKLRASKKSSGMVKWKVKGTAGVTPPLFDVDTALDGALVRLEADGGTLVDVAIPGSASGTPCSPEDGWKRRRGGRASYVNESGFLDGACSVPAAGLHTARIDVVKKKAGRQVRYAFAGTSAAGVSPERLRVTVGLGDSTGPCWTGAASCDGGRCRGEAPGGAFEE